MGGTGMMQEQVRGMRVWHVACVECVACVCCACPMFTLLPPQ